MKENTFRRCHNGHYYQGEDCPYCKSSNNAMGDCLQPKISEDTKICPHGHSYGRQLDCCPYCGETEISGFEPTPTLWPASLIITFKHSIVIYVDGVSIKEGFHVEVNYNGSRARSNYRIFDSPINYKSVIRIGETMFIGKAFVNMVDLLINAKMIDNN